jgi:hypothetical protein
MSKVIEAIELTEADRKRWPYMDNDNGRRAMKHISLQPADKLLACVSFDRFGDFDYDNEKFMEFYKDFGNDTNHGWLSAQIAEELYTRGEIDERKFDRVMGH